MPARVAPSIQGASETEHGLRILFEVTKELIAVVRFDGYFETASPSWVGVLGWTQEELLSTPIWELIHPDDLEEAARVAEQFTAAGGHLVEFRNRYRCKDGSYRVLAWTNYADIDGQRVYCVARDITELRGQADELLKLFTLTDDLIAIGPGKGDYDILSPSWTTLLGWSIEELKAMDVRTLMHPDDLEGALAQADGMRASKEVTKGFGARFRCKDGSYRSLSWTAYIDDIGNRAYTIGRDTTEMKAQAQKLDEQTRAWEAFAYTLAHDIRSPVRSISGLTELIRRGADTMDAAKMDRCVDMIQQRVRDVDAMTTKMLTFAQSGGAAMDENDVQMDQLVMEQVDLLRDAGASTVNFAIGALPSCHGDPTLIGIAVANLMQNACKFAAGDECRVEVTGTVDGNTATYAIADNGVGFDAEVAKSIWQPMVRGHSRDAFSGTGLGLATVKRIVEQHGGAVDCTGSPGEGAVFSFSLPRGPRDSLD